MPAYRYFLKNPLISDSDVILEGVEFHHFLHVMRQGVGDIVELVNGKGGLAQARVDDIRKKCAALHLLEATHAAPPSFSVILAQAITRQHRLDFILEKGTELGMTELWLYPTLLSEKKSFAEHQRDRMEAVASAAMKQCGRLDEPQIVFKSFLEKWDSFPFPCYYGDLSPSAPSLHHLWNHAPPKEGVIICIGPESGFKESETEVLKQKGAQPMKLHPNILRADTAALAALSIVTHLRL